MSHGGGRASPRAARRRRTRRLFAQTRANLPQLISVAKAVAPTPTTAFDARQKIEIRPDDPERDRRRARRRTERRVGDRGCGAGVAPGRRNYVWLRRERGAPEACGGCDGGVIFIDAERKFSGARMAEIARGKLGIRSTRTRRVALANSSVQVITPTSLSDLGKRLDALEEAIIDHNVRLVIIDSVAHPREGGIRTREGGPETECLGAVASMLKRHAENHALPVLAVNQVTTRIGTFAKHASDKDNTDDAGLEESSGITMRCGRGGRNGVNVSNSIRSRRRASTNKNREKAHWRSPTSFDYFVDGSGICISGKTDENEILVSSWP